jgi:CIC family chloride channel protein
LFAAEASPNADGVVLIHFADGSGYALGSKELESLGAYASPETAIGDLVAELRRGERLPLLYPDMPLDATLRHFARWPALLIRNRARATAIEGVLTEAQVLACYRDEERVD